MSGGTLAISSNNFTVLCMVEAGKQSAPSAYYPTTKTTEYNLGIGHRIAKMGSFQTRAYIGIGTIRQQTEASAYYSYSGTYYPGAGSDDFRPNISFGFIGDGKIMSFLTSVESNYTGVSLVLGIGINSSMFARK